MPAPTLPPLSSAKHIGPNIKRLREGRGLTQLALGLAVGWTGAEAGAHVSRIESGEVEPRMDTLARLASALDAGLIDLIEAPEKRGGKGK